ncbi:MAG: hypothetical protein FWC41_00015 [Firmicutes bacterium]|nr:hypothetical protein [Bacillota bacterium]
MTNFETWKDGLKIEDLEIKDCGYNTCGNIGLDCEICPANHCCGTSSGMTCKHYFLTWANREYLDV